MSSASSVIAFALQFAGTLACVGLRSRRIGAPPLFALIAAVAAAPFLLDPPPGRSGLDWLCTAIVAVALAEGSWLGVAFATVAAVVWVNAGAFGVVVPLVAALAIVFPGVARTKALVAIVLCSLATCATPAGIALPLHALTLAHLGHGDAPIVLLGPETFAPFAYRAGIPAFIVAAFVAARIKPSGRGESVGLLLPVVLAFADGRWVALVGILCLPGIVARIATLRATREVTVAA